MINQIPFQAPDSMSEQIAQHIGKKIISGNLAPKERIQEIKISSELSVSRGSVREALLILQQRHLVTIQARKGATVSELSIHHVNALYDFYVTLLEMLTTSLAARWEDIELVTPLLDKIKSIENLNERSQKHIELILEAGFEVMRDAAKLVNNPYLQEALENLQPAIHRTYYLAMQVRHDGIKDSRIFLQKMAEGVVKRDNSLLIESIREFAEGQRKAVLSALK